MAKNKMLTDKEIENAPPKNKPYKRFDSQGLYLLIMPNGSKYWRYKFRFLGKEKKIALGVYPTVTLKEARKARDKNRELVAAGIDPAQDKKKQKRQAMVNGQNTFEVVAREWHETKLTEWQPKHGKTILRRLEANIFPFIGSRPIVDIDAPELLDVLRKVEKRKAYHLAGQLKQICGKIFRYAIATSRCNQDVAAHLKEALKKGTKTHFAALDIKEMPEFLKVLEKNHAYLQPRTIRAIRMLMLSFTRTRELIEAKWDEFDFENAVWIVPATRMKNRKSHIVPLSKQAIALLKEQKEETGHYETEWVFPNQQHPRKPMSNNTILFGLGRLGYKGIMTGHGFRAVARTIIRENLRYDADIIELQLSHAPGGGNKTIAAYDRTKFLDDRKLMMQDWADYLDEMASQGKVIEGKFRKSS